MVLMLTWRCSPVQAVLVAFNSRRNISSDCNSAFVATPLIAPLVPVNGALTYLSGAETHVMILVGVPYESREDRMIGQIERNNARGIVTSDVNASLIASEERASIGR